MTLNESSKKVGKYRGFFFQMQDRNPDKFNCIKELGEGNVVKGYRIYNDELDVRIDGFVALYNELEFNRLVLPFSKKYGYQHSYIAHMASRIEGGGVRYKVFAKLPTIIEQMTEYLEDKGIIG